MFNIFNNFGIDPLPYTMIYGLAISKPLSFNILLRFSLKMKADNKIGLCENIFKSSYNIKSIFYVSEKNGTFQILMYAQGDIKIVH